MSSSILFYVENVYYNKVNGKLVLYEDRLGWSNNSNDFGKFDIEKLYKIVKQLRISSPEKRRVQLQFLSYNGIPVTFEFQNPISRDERIADRDKVKDICSKFINKHTDEEIKDLEVKKKVLENNKHIIEVYLDLMSGNYMTNDQFWKVIEILPTTTEATENKIRISDNVIHESMPTIRIPETYNIPAISNGFIYANLNDKKKNDIMNVFESVRQHYRMKVPKDLTDDQFWKEFFQSEYYHKSLSKFVVNKEFSNCGKKDNDLIQKVGKDFTLKTLQCDNPNLIEDDDAYDNTSTLLIKRWNRESIFLNQSIMTRYRENQSEDEYEVCEKKLKLDFVNETPKKECDLYYDDEILVWKNVENKKADLKQLNLVKFPLTKFINPQDAFKMAKNLQKNLENDPGVSFPTNAEKILEEIGYHTKIPMPIEKKSNTITSEIAQKLKKTIYMFQILSKFYWSTIPLTEAQIKQRLMAYYSLERFMDTVKDFEINNRSCEKAVDICKSLKEKFSYIQNNFEKLRK